MLIKNTIDKFGLITKILHWVIAVLIIGLIYLGWYMVDLTYYDKWYNSSLSWHKSLGMIVIALVLIKICWQLYTPAPESVVGLKFWEAISAYIMHIILLFLMLAIPVSGYIISSSAGQSIPVFDWFSIPAILKITATVRDWAIALHFYMAYGTAGLVTIHVIAAIKHQFIDKNNTLKRMLNG